jgi:hypothetical protein
VLFLIAGLTAGYLLPSRSAGQLLKSRLLRLIPPLLMTMVCVYPISLALFMAFAGDAVAYVPSPGHLWFVWNLGVYFILAYPLLRWFKARPNGRFLRLLDKVSPWGWLVLLPAFLLLVTWFLEPYIDAESFPTHFIRFSYGFACFVSGLVLVSLGDAFWRGIRRVCHVALLVTFAIYLARMFEVDFGGRFSSLLAFLGYGSLLLDRPSKVFSLLNRSVLAVYIIHMPLQQLVAMGLFPLKLGAWPTFALHSLGTLAACGLVYALILRPIPWLHPWFGIPALKKKAPVADEGGEATPSRPPWIVRAARFTTLYLISPLMVLITVGVLIAAVFFGDTWSDPEGQRARFEAETAARSVEENRAEIQSLRRQMKEAKQEGKEAQAKFLAFEIGVIQEALKERGEEKQDQARANAPPNEE